MRFFTTVICLIPRREIFSFRLSLLGGNWTVAMTVSTVCNCLIGVTFIISVTWPRVSLNSIMAGAHFSNLICTYRASKYAPLPTSSDARSFRNRLSEKLRFYICLSKWFRNLHLLNLFLATQVCLFWPLKLNKRLRIKIWIKYLTPVVV